MYYLLTDKVLFFYIHGLHYTDSNVDKNVLRFMYDCEQSIAFGEDEKYFIRPLVATCLQRENFTIFS